MLFHFTCNQVHKTLWVLASLLLLKYRDSALSLCTYVCVLHVRTVCVRVTSLSLSPPAVKTQRPVLTALLQSWLSPSSEIKFLLSQAAYWVRPWNTGVVAAEQTTQTLKTTSGCLLTLLKASMLHLIWFTKGGQLGNRLCIELLWISSLWNNATSLCKLRPEECSAVGLI